MCIIYLFTHLCTGLGLLCEVPSSHSDTPHSVGLLLTSDQPDSETSVLQHTTLTTVDINDFGGIRTRNPNKRVTADPRLSLRGHWDRLPGLLFLKNSICHLVSLTCSTSLKWCWQISRNITKVRRCTKLQLSSRYHHVKGRKSIRDTDISLTGLEAERSRFRFPTASLEFFIDIILLAALWPWGRLSL